MKDVDDLRTNSTSKFLFYNFNMLRLSDGEKPLLLRHSQIAHDECTLEKLQNKSWQCFVETLLKVSNQDIKYSVIKNQRERNIVDKTVNNLNYCKNIYNTAFIDITTYLRQALEHTHQEDIEDIQNDLKSRVYDVGEMMENPNYREVLQLSSQYYFKTGSFPIEKKLYLRPRRCD